jgi:hypothetical protein
MARAPGSGSPGGPLTCRRAVGARFAARAAATAALKSRVPASFVAISGGTPRAIMRWKINLPVRP